MIIIATLAEKKYFYGVAALIHSIVKNGTYANKIIVGYRGDLPAWLPPLQNTKNGKSFRLKNDLEIEFVVVDGTYHMAHEKPQWLRRLTEILEPGADEYFFFDSDILVLNRMTFFGEWVQQGVALCEDVNYNMDMSHPIRKQWIKLANGNGMAVTNPLNRYINAGFAGWSKSCVQFVIDWHQNLLFLSPLCGDMRQFCVHDRTNVIYTADQDSLNFTAMTTHCPISVIGPEAMGFQYGFPLMAHPLGAKPWDRKFVKEFLLGKPPRRADLLFWEYVNQGDLKPYANYFVKYKLFIIKTLRFLSRFYRAIN